MSKTPSNNQKSSMRTAEVSVNTDPLAAIAGQVDDTLDFADPWHTGRGTARFLLRRERLICQQDRRVHLNIQPWSSSGPLALSGEWQQLKKKLILTLERFPEAYEAVLVAIRDDDDPPHRGSAQ